MTAQFEEVNPTVVGNEYLVVGTLDKKDWRGNKTTPMDSRETVEKTYVFKDVWEFEVRKWWMREE